MDALIKKASVEAHFARLVVDCSLAWTRFLLAQLEAIQQPSEAPFCPVVKNREPSCKNFKEAENNGHVAMVMKLVAGSIS